MKPWTQGPMCYLFCSVFFKFTCDSLHVRFEKLYNFCTLLEHNFVSFGKAINPLQFSFILWSCMSKCMYHFYVNLLACKQENHRLFFISSVNCETYNFCRK